jgi:putative ABC transport system permease protein
MDLISSLQMAWRSIAINKLRSALTMLGVIIGVASVITMVALSQGTASGITDRISSMGANLLTVSPSGGFGPVRGGASTARLTMGDVEAIRSLPLIANVAPEVGVNGATLTAGNNTWTSAVTGTTPELQSIKKWETVDGEFFTYSDVDEISRVAVVGQTIVENLFPGGTSPVGQSFRINGVNFTVIGVLEEKGDSGMSDQDDIVYIPLTTAQQRFTGSQTLRSINVQATSTEALTPLKNYITTLLRQRHRLAMDADNDFRIQDMSELLSTIEDTTKMMSFLLGGIAAVSLLVGGIGIMNIMLVSVTERTREIGIRMAIGATTRAILSQFLIEALLLCFIGGVIGVLLGCGAAYIMGNLADIKMKISPWLILISMGFSVMIGLFFGYYPARKAAHSDPIEALRFE